MIRVQKGGDQTPLAMKKHHGAVNATDTISARVFLRFSLVISGSSDCGPMAVVLWALSDFFCEHHHHNELRQRTTAKEHDEQGTISSDRVALSSFSRDTKNMSPQRQGYDNPIGSR